MKHIHTAPDTRTMAIVHSALRRDLHRARIVLRSAEPLTGQRRTALADHLVWMMDFLNHHHTGEDEGLYPLVLERDPAARELLASMDADHRRIHPAMDHLTEAARSFRTGSTDGSHLIHAIEELESVLYPHLEREEREMMPVVAASITAADWRRWDHDHNIKPLSFGELAATGLWILDGQDPDSDALMSKAVPAPIRVLIKKGFGPRYRRKAAAVWGGTAAAELPALSADAVEHTR